MSDKFIFNPIFREDVLEYKKTAHKCSISLKDLEKLRFVESHFDTVDMGGSSQRIDIYISGENPPVSYNCLDIREHLDIDKFLVEEGNPNEGNPEVSNGLIKTVVYNLSGMLEYLKTKDYNPSEVLVITRTMSSYALDRDTASSHAISYNICSQELSDFLDIHPILAGWLSKLQITFVDGNYKRIIKNVIEDEYAQGRLSEYNYLLYKDLVK